MKRDPRLRRLSFDHHHALVLARRAARGDVSLDDVRYALEHELTPHFAVEEQTLIPALARAGAPELADQARLAHAQIRASVDVGDVATFARLLTEHVRFEERELFPACEQRLTSEVLDAVFHAYPATPR